MKPAARAHRASRQLLVSLICMAAMSAQAQVAQAPVGKSDPQQPSAQRVVVQADRVPGGLLSPRNGRLEPADSTVSLLEVEALTAPGNSSLAAVLAAVPSVGENFAAVGYYENFTIRGFTLDMGSAFRVNGMVVPGEWQFPLEGTAALQVAAGVAGSSGGLVGAGGSLNQITPRGGAPLRARLESDAQAGTLLAVDGGRSHAVWSWRTTASHARLRPPFPGADGHRSFIGMALDAAPHDGVRLFLDLALQRRSQPVVPGFQLLGGSTPPDLSVRGVNLNAQPWSRPFTNNGHLAMLRIEGGGPGGMRWEAGLSRAQARIDDNLATPFGCNTPPFEFFCSNGDYVLYDYHASETRTTSHARFSAVKPFSAAGIQHELQAGLERIDRKVLQRDVYNATSYDAAGLALSGNIYRPDSVLARPVAPGADRPPSNSSQSALTLGYAATLGPWRSVLGLRWTEIDAPGTLPDERRLLPRWTLSWQPGPSMRVFASVARGLAFGSEAPATAANAGEVLAPRVTRQVEAGWKSRVGDAWQYGLTAFQTERPWEFVEPVGSSWAGRGAWVQRGRQRHEGVEAAFAWTFEASARLEGRFAYINAKGRGSELIAWDGRQLQNIPRTALHLRLARQLNSLPGLSYNAALTARSSKPANADGSVWVSGYSVIDLGLSWKLPSSGPSISLDVGVRNVADRRYWRDSGQAYSADLLFPGAARALSVALKVGGYE
ncbi:TonB-dependent receptor [Rubrivivax rivuli]|uniref:TonB-dependent receptor n=1 Tax=Rubrivivax rivuli TaxID=1862385 RepID=UPI0013E2B0A1|nr:TonB-dependent receptor [Rubrivivax rivuli]